MAGKLSSLFGKKSKAAEIQTESSQEPSYNKELAAVLEEVIYQAKLSENFLFSGWESVDQAVGDLVPLLEGVKANDQGAVDQLKILFAPTGRLQELSIDNSWEQEYLALAKRFDAAL